MCGKGVKTKQALQFHMNSHSGLKRFNCSLCSMTFTTRNSMAAHTRRHVIIYHPPSTPTPLFMYYYCNDHVERDVYDVDCSLLLLSQTIYRREKSRTRANTATRPSLLHRPGAVTCSTFTPHRANTVNKPGSIPPS